MATPRHCCRGPSLTPDCPRLLRLDHLDRIAKLIELRLHLGGIAYDHPDETVGVDGPADCLVQLRAHGEVHACTAWLDGDALRIRLHHPARGVAKGQATVLYADDVVLGSATISATSTVTPLAPTPTR